MMSWVSWWERWRQELPELNKQLITWYYHPRHAHIVSTRLHRFSDVSESANAGVAYLHMFDASGPAYLSLIISKTKVAPIEQLIVSRLELCGTCLLAELLHSVRDVLQLPSDQIFTWTDSTIWEVIHDGSKLTRPTVCFKLLRFYHQITHKTICTVHTEDCTHLSSLIILYIGKDQIGWSWKNVSGPASHFLLFILCHKKTKLTLNVSTQSKPPVILFTQYSKFSHMTHVTTWILRFIHNCQAKKVSNS